LEDDDVSVSIAAVVDALMDLDSDNPIAKLAWIKAIEKFASSVVSVLELLSP